MLGTGTISDHFMPLRAAVHAVLNAPANFNWTVQGLGMLRCYPFAGSTWRLNVWNDTFRRVPPASDMHDHPWHLTSWIMSGELFNQRYIPVDDDMPGALFNFVEIQCGPNAAHCSLEPAGTVRLGKLAPERYGPGTIYSQRASEIHSTTFMNGTVTLNKRERVNGDAAKIFFPASYEWVDAAPREATPLEVAAGCNIALRAW